MRKSAAFVWSAWVLAVVVIAMQVANLLAVFLAPHESLVYKLLGYDGLCNFVGVTAAIALALWLVAMLHTEIDSVEVQEPVELLGRAAAAFDHVEVVMLREALALA